MKEEAERIFNVFYNIISQSDGRYKIEWIAKQCAINHVQEMIDLLTATTWMVEGSLAYKHLVDLKTQIESL